MEKIKILYIDDILDTNLSRYLDEYSIDKYKLEYSDIKFDSNKGYQNLIEDIDVQSSNIIIIDSKLFENNNANQGKFTGEEFKIILKKYFPFIEVLVVTQNPIREDYKTISKCDKITYREAKLYYDKELSPKIEDSIKNVCEFRKIASVMEENDKLDKVLVEKITNLLNGCEIYDELTKSDIDEIVNIFKEIQEDIDG